MMFHAAKKWFALLFLIWIVGVTPAVGDSKAIKPDQLTAIVNAHPTTIAVSVTPEVLFTINDIRTHNIRKQYFKDSLDRMQKYKPMILAELKKQSLPEELLAVPLVESGYQMLTAERNLEQSAGIWQLLPSTAKQYGLTAEIIRDDRLNAQVDTVAALSYLKDLYRQFQDWNLVLIAYELGPQQTADLIKQVGSKDPWVLVRSSKAPTTLRQFFPNLQATIIIMNEPKILD